MIVALWLTMVLPLEVVQLWLESGGMVLVGYTAKGLMTPVNISISDITYVDFKAKKIVGRQVLPFEKIDLLREGLIDFHRIVKRGHVTLVTDNFGNRTYLKVS
jgi:hypothetical protein